MQSRAPDVDAYLAEAPDERREALTHIRRLCRQLLKGYDEGMQYGMPVYKKGGAAEVGFASQKGYIALYVTKKDVVDAHRDRLKGLSVGKGCIRFARPERIDWPTVESLLAGTVKSEGKSC